MTIANQTFRSVILGATLLIGCNYSKPSKVEASITGDEPKEEIEFKAQAAEDTVKYMTEVFPKDTVFMAKVMTPGTFHRDEAWKDIGKETWFGVFKNKNESYLARTEIRTRRVFDAILDDDSTKNKTGWEIRSVNKDTCLMLISGLDFLKDHSIPKVAITKSEFYPGEMENLNYLNIDCQIFAVGKKRLRESGEAQIWNYKLFLAAAMDGKIVTELLSAAPNFDSQMIKIIFAGDIDGDGLLDLIVDTSRHYNGTTPTLYLSKPAKQGHLLIVAGRHASVGC